MHRSASRHLGRAGHAQTVERLVRSEVRQPIVQDEASLREVKRMQEERGGARSGEVSEEAVPLEEGVICIAHVLDSRAQEIVGQPVGAPACVSLIEAKNALTV